MQPNKLTIKYAAISLVGAALSVGAYAQTAPASDPERSETAVDTDVIVLSPFEVTGDSTTGYTATSTLAGSRINTQLKDVGSAISVVTSEFLKDTGATDSKSLLMYTTNTEVASISGNFTKASSGNQSEEGTFTTPNTNTRVRGLTSADNTRGFFVTDIPWDSYNVDRVDMQRGPNSILFGMGSPAGIINTTTKTAQYRNFGEIEFRYGSFGANRISLDYNHTLLEDELAMRVNLVRNDEQYKQQPAYSLDRRVFVTARYEPKFLNRGDSKTTIKVNYESGSIRSNNPRVITPIDMITPWFNNLNKVTYNPAYVNDNQPRYTYDGADNVASVAWLTGANGPALQRTYGNYIPVGQPYNSTTGLLSGGANATYQPWLSNVASSYESGPMTYFLPGETTASTMYMTGFGNTIGSRNSTGGLDAGLDAFPSTWQQVAIAPFATYANNAGIPYAAQGLWKNYTISDSSIFDFYNNLLDGGNKNEWQNFHNFSGSLSQTFFKQKLGFEIAYDQSTYRRGQFSLLTDQRAGIMVDMNTTTIEGAPNPNLGKPFIADAGIYANGDAQNDREASRISAFFDHNFNEDGKGRWFMKLLGRHTLSALYSQDMLREQSRSFMRWGTGLDLAALVTTDPNGQTVQNNRRIVHPAIYLGDSLLTASSASGANIGRAGDEVQFPGTVGFRYFDSTWNAPSSVGFGDRYINPRTGAITTQSENPSNYVGWKTSNVTVLDSKTDAAARDALSFSANLARKKSNSRAAVIQSYFWDGAVVGMYGIRRDNIKSWAASPYRTGTGDTPADGHIDFERIVTRTIDGVSYTAPAYSTVAWPYSSVTQNTPSWSVVVHLAKLLGRWGDSLPVNLSFYYNTSSNFQVMGTRTNIYGSALGLPSGKTLDRGITISTKDDRFSLRINKYESNVLNSANTSGLNTWLIGNNSDTLFTWGENWADTFEYNLGAQGDPASANNGATWRYDYAQGLKADGTMQTAEEAAAQEVAAVAGWRALTANPSIQAFLRSFGYSDFNTTQNTTLTRNPTFALSEDSVSRGWEFELTANPTKNWRVSLNASKTTAQRSNIGGPGFAEFVDIVNTAMVGAAGDIRLWSGGNPSNAIRNQWNNVFYSQYALMALQEGTNSPELRKWRFNLVTNYDFTEGRLKGLNVGMGYRWQDKVAIGYRPIDGATGVSFDLENPYMGPREDAFDFWVGYGKKLTDKVDWRIQLNVRNAFDGNDLIPLTAQPDGSIAAWRIAPRQTWTITNTFKF